MKTEEDDRADLRVRPFFLLFVIPVRAGAYAFRGGECMAYGETQKTAPKEHALNMQNRARLSLTGVVDVNGFDEGLIALATAQGPLAIRGEGLHIDRIDLTAGELEVRGKIRELSYEEPETGGGFWSRLFG